MKYYTIREVAEILGVKVRTVREWLRLGKIQAERSDNGWYWMISEEEVARHANKD